MERVNIITTLFYKKDYEAALKKIDNLRALLVETEISRDNLKVKVNAKEKQLKAIEEFKQMMIDMNEELVTEVESKEKLLKLKDKEIEELKSNRYLVKKIPTGRRPKTQKTKVTHTVKPNVQNYQRNEVVE